MDPRNIQSGYCVRMMLIVFLLSGCASFSKDLQKEERTAPPFLNLPEMISYPPFEQHLPDLKRKLRRRVKSLVIQDSDIREVMKLLFHESDINLRIDPDVKGSITLQFKNMSLEAIMESILETEGYLHTFSNNTLRIGRRGTRVFTLNLAANAQANAWKSIEAELKQLMTESGQIILNANAGTIMVTDHADNLERVGAYIEMIEEAMSRQVLVETKIIEVVLSDTFQFGVDYSLFAKTIGMSGAGLLSGGAAFSQSLSPGAGAVKFGVAKENKFSVMLDLLQTQGQVTVLSSPRIVTLNNVTATINIAEQIPVIGRTIVDSTAGSRTEFDISFEDAGISLDVTPKIGKSGEMIMQVKPKITEQTGTITTPDGLQTQPILNVRESSNSIKVRDGESIVIGGFIQDRKTEVISKVPFFGDIPIINPLFKSTNQKMEKVELIIVLTPIILSGVMNRRMLDDSMERIRQMTRPFSPGILKGKEKQGITKGFLDDYEVSDRVEAITIEASRYIKGPAGKQQHVSRKGMAEHYLKKGKKAFEQGGYEKALAAYERSLFFDPLAGEGYCQLALIYEQIGNKEKSRRMLEKYLMQGVPSSTSLNELAITYSKGHDQHLAARLLETALKEDRRNPSLHNNRGVIYKRMGRLEIAADAFGESLSYAPDFPEALYNIALVLEAQKQYTGAVSYYWRFLESASPSREQTLADIKSHMNILTGYIEKSLD